MMYYFLVVSGFQTFDPVPNVYYFDIGQAVNFANARATATELPVLVVTELTNEIQFVAGAQYWRNPE